MPSAAVAYISSTLVKDVAALGGSLDGLVPPAVAAAPGAPPRRWKRHIDV